MDADQRYDTATDSGFNYYQSDLTGYPRQYTPADALGNGEYRVIVTVGDPSAAVPATDTGR